MLPLSSPASSCSVDDAVDALWDCPHSVPCDEDELSSFLSSYLYQTPLGFYWTPETNPETCTPSQGLQALPAPWDQGCTAAWIELGSSAAAHLADAQDWSSEASSSSSEASERAPASPEGGKRRAQYNQSQWTQEEHERFLRALEKYLPSENRKDPITGRVSVGLGAGVAKQVSAIVGTRSPLQVRTHAQ
eukprot:476609-Hanusia_phi.AAC.1